MKKMLIVLLVVAAAAGVAVYAQDTNQETYMELLRSDLKTQKVGIGSLSEESSARNAVSFSESQVALAVLPPLKP